MDGSRTYRVDVNKLSPEEFAKHLRELSRATLEITPSVTRQRTLKGGSAAQRANFFGQPGGTLRHRPKE